MKIAVRGVAKLFGERRRFDDAFSMLAEGRTKTEVQEALGVMVGTYGIDLDVEAGRTFVLMGLSGSGKSTLLRLLNRLLEPTRGEIRIDGEDVTALDRRGLIALRRRVFAGMVFQRFAILPHRTTLDNVALGLELQGVARTERHERAAAMIELVGLSGWEQHRPASLSGGMQQRVGLARALVLDGNVMLMDEPFSALDPLIRRELQDELVQLQERVQKTIVFVTHDLDEALKLGDRITMLKDARVQQVGTPQQIVTEPANDYVRAFVEGVNRTEVLTARVLMRPLEAGEPDTPLRVAGRTPLKEILELVADGPRGVPVCVQDEHDTPIGVIDRRTLFAVLAGRALEDAHAAPEDASPSTRGGTP
ncbi:MAG: betaine/proline/choline family ABC transporter ATP-binding protein [Trueperaceae bacterium]|nr:betaine/proline/choline family ABC transporter ATP-binding protein [Trueperaceae bacterium]